MEEQAAAGQQLLANYGVSEDNVRVMRALDYSGSFVLQTSDDMTEEELEAQIEDIPGFAIVEEAEEVDEEGGGEEGEEEGGVGLCAVKMVTQIRGKHVTVERRA